MSLKKLALIALIVVMLTGTIIFSGCKPKETVEEYEETVEAVEDTMNEVVEGVEEVVEEVPEEVPGN